MEPAAATGGKRSKWMTHVKATMKANKGKSLMEVLKMAKKTYKKTGGGLSPLPLTGARRRRGGKDEEVMETAPVAAEMMAVKGGRKTRKAGRKGGRKSRKGGMYH